MHTKGLRTWIEVNRANLRNNYAFFRKLIGKKCRLMAVVKSNAYGHGLVDFSREMQKFGVDWLGVDSIVEALTLRRRGIKKPLLVLGYTLPENYRRAVAHNIRLSVSTFEGIAAAGRTGAVFHLKVDTGMHRQGFQESDIPRVLSALKKHHIKKSQFEGLFTHLAAPANRKFLRATRTQIAQFKRIATLFEKAGYVPMKHTAATGGALFFPESHFDMVRIGIGLYGLWPSAPLRAERRFGNKLKPALSWKTRISEIKKISKGEAIGYDFTHRLKREARVAICPIGYWHGYPRALSNIGTAIIQGKLVPILGRVSMDMIVIDITRVPSASVGQEVMLIGYKGGVGIHADELAKKSGTTSYEILTRLNPLMKKFYL